MNLLDKAGRILEQPVCDYCLGSQFGQLLSGYSNRDRGRFFRTLVAMGIDKEDYDGNIDLSNFSGFKFHNLDKKIPKTERCSICSDFFDSLDVWVRRIIAKAERYQFNTFLVGTKLKPDMIAKEEDLWERVGIDYCEPIKAEINREIGKRVEKSLKKRCDIRNPDINFILDIPKNRIVADINPLFIYGEYQKLVRGIPQTRWPSGKYKISIEQIVAKPFMKITKGNRHKFHGLGREDIDARCLAWRPFVLEIIQPEKRAFKLKGIDKKIKKGVRVRKLRFSDVYEVRRVKEARVDKSYRAIVQCQRSIKKSDLKKLQSLKLIRQKTPRRVLHRRADRSRKRAVRSIKTRWISRRKFELIVRGEAGLYIKELVDGDDGRTRPSVSEILDVRCSCKNLDVIKIYTKK